MSGFGPRDLCAMLSGLGVECKVERGKRVFPVSDRAADVRNALFRYCMDQGARFVFRKRITGLAVEDGQVKGVVDSDGQQLPADAVIVATGGDLLSGNRQHRRWVCVRCPGRPHHRGTTASTGSNRDP